MLWVAVFDALGGCRSAPSLPEALPEPDAAPTPLAAKHAMLLVIDTLRADGLAAAETPHLDAIAQRGDAVERAWSAGTWTVPSVVSVLTGMPVRQHGWDLPTGRIGSYPPLPEAPTLATVLQGAGFGTFGVYANPYLAEQLGFDKGFETWRRASDQRIPTLLARHVEEEWGDGRRHFAYVHLIGPHSPLKPSESAAARWGVAPSWLDASRGLGIGAAKRNREDGVRAAYRAAYHAVIEDTDERVGAILGALGKHREETVVLVVSDHGEMLGEHNKVGHGTMVYEPLTHVPFLIDRGTLPETLGIASAPAVLTAHLGVAHEWPTSADAALPLVAQREGLVALSEDGRLKGIWEEGSFVAYNLVEDPGETSPLGQAPGLDEARRKWEAAFPPGGTLEDAINLHPNTIEELKAMGYLE